LHDRTSSRVRAVRSRDALGWKPTHSNEDFLETIEEQAQFVIDEEKLLGRK